MSLPVCFPFTAEPTCKFCKNGVGAGEFVVVPPDATVTETYKYIDKKFVYTPVCQGCVDCVKGADFGIAVPYRRQGEPMLLLVDPNGGSIPEQKEIGEATAAILADEVVEHVQPRAHSTSSMHEHGTIIFEEFAYTFPEMLELGSSPAPSADEERESQRRRQARVATDRRQAQERVDRLMAERLQREERQWRQEQADRGRQIQRQQGERNLGVFPRSSRGKEKAEAPKRKDSLLPKLLEDDTAKLADDTPGSFECLVCMETRKRKFVFGCGHGQICVLCMHELEEQKTLDCPQCRTKITAVVPLFW